MPTPRPWQPWPPNWGWTSPAWQRYLQWVHGLLTGALGDSYAYGCPVAELILGAPAAHRSAGRPGHAAGRRAGAWARAYTLPRNHQRRGDVGSWAWPSIGIAMPNFWFAILLILLFSVKLQWLSAGGFPAGAPRMAAASGRAAGPACCPPLPWPWCRLRSWRASHARPCWTSCARTSCARPAPRACRRRAALWRHVLRNAMIPVVTVMGLQFANLLAGTIVVENVFYLPGLGRLIFQSIANRDLHRGAQLRACCWLPWWWWSTSSSTC